MIVIIVINVTFLCCVHLEGDVHGGGEGVQH